MVLESQFQREARSANERQDTPSNKACSPKIETVLFRPIQHSATSKSFPSVSFRVSQPELLNCFSSRDLAIQN